MVLWYKRLWHQKELCQAWITNYIPQYSVGCNCLSMPEIPASAPTSSWNRLIYIWLGLLNHFTWHVNVGWSKYRGQFSPKNTKSYLCSASVTRVLYAISCCSGPSYNSTGLYFVFLEVSHMLKMGLWLFTITLQWCHMGGITSQINGNLTLCSTACSGN